MLDFSPYRRSLIGFDHLFDLLQNATTFDVGGYPPYDVEQHGDDAYRIRLALAGYTSEEIDITTKEGVLLIAGRKEEPEETRKFLHRGIPAGGFERTFQLADHVIVTGATFQDGMLEVDLKREIPEAAKPRKIAISQAKEPRRISKTSDKKPTVSEAA
jgi:molecular chaperone IbpA